MVNFHFYIGKTTVQSIAKEEDPEKGKDFCYGRRRRRSYSSSSSSSSSESDRSRRYSFLKLETEERPKRSRKVIVKDRTHLRAAVHHKAARADLHQDRNKSEEINQNNKWKRIETTIDTMI